MGPEFWKHGCLLGTFAAELAETSPRIHDRVAELFDDLVSRLAPLFLAVVADEETALALAEQTLIVLEGSVVLARAHDDPDRIATAVRRFRRTLEEYVRQPSP